MTLLAAVLAAAQAAATPSPAPSPLPVRTPGQQTLVTDYQTRAGIRYATAGGQDLHVDVYRPRRQAGPNPTVVLYHGGGWVTGNKESSVLWVVPWIEAGFSVVSVQYRIGGHAPAPAAVEDALCALRWVFVNAEAQGFDPARIVTTGDSAGGHLALAAAFIPSSSGLARGCPIAGQGVTWASPPPAWDPQVAAVVNWYGVTDVADLLDGPNARSYAIEWLGSREDRAEAARRVSPLTYVRPGVPPVITFHGDADTVVPYAHAVRLHDALGRAGATHRLVTLRGGRHGGFDRAQLATIAEETRAFLGRVLPAGPIGPR